MMGCGDLAGFQRFINLVVFKDTWIGGQSLFIKFVGVLNGHYILLQKSAIYPSHVTCGGRIAPFLTYVIVFVSVRVLTENTIQRKALRNSWY
jgi:hypothetical protein